MKILLISDLHSQNRALLSLKKILSKSSFDLVLSAGDIVDLSDSKLDFYNKVVKTIQAESIKFLGVPGNNDSRKVFQEMVRSKVNLHLNPQKVGSYTFYGIGGWGYDFEFPMKNPKRYRCDNKTVFISHIPPKVAIIKKIINKPLIHICGHLHGLAKLQTIPAISRGGDDLLLINLPALMLEKAAVLELPSKKVKFISLT